MQNCLFIGVDVALKGNQFCAMNFDQHIYFNLKFPNNPEGNEMVINKIKDIEDKSKLKKFDCGNKELNEFFSHYALKNDILGIGKTFVGIDYNNISS